MRSRQCHRALLLLMLVGSLASPAFSRGTPRRLLAPAPSTLSGRAIVLQQDVPGSPSQRLLVLRTGLGRWVRILLEDPEQLDQIQTGMHVEALGDWHDKPAAVFKATQLTATGAAVSGATTVLPAASRSASMVNAAAAGGPALDAPWIINQQAPSTTDVNTLVIPIVGITGSGEYCPGTLPAPVSVEEVRRTVFGGEGYNGTSVAAAFTQCSYGKSPMNTNNSTVADIVKLPCSGISNSGTAWTMQGCSLDDINGWADAAEEQLRSSGFPLDSYKYRVYLLPPGNCSIVGMGYVGCDGTPGFECRAWVGARHWNSSNAYVHEMGHNMFLGHGGGINAQGDYDQYADPTCAMGYCCQSRCFNMPHAWQLGWLAVQQLDGNSLKPGQTLAVTLPSQATSDRAGVRVVPSWVSGVDPIFVGLRTRTGGDAFLPDQHANRVHVITSPSNQTYDSRKSNWRTALSAAGQSWEEPTAGVVVRLQQLSSSSGAVVTLCRKAGAETSASCLAGLDNDCNGLAGDKEPACGQFVSAAASGRKRVRRPRRPARRVRV